MSLSHWFADHCVRRRCWWVLSAAVAVACPLAGAEGRAGWVELSSGRLELFADGVRQLDAGRAGEVTVFHAPGGQAAGELTFLHAFRPGRGIAEWRAATGLAHRKVGLLPDWPEVFRYELEYADGGRVSIPVRFGESIEAVRRVQTVGPMLWAREHVAIESGERTGERDVYYVMRIPNPRPHQALRLIRALPPPDRHHEHGQALLLGCAPTESAEAGRLFFVDHPPVGEDQNPGTFEAPFGSLARAVAAAVPGDTILVRGGRHPLVEPVLLNFVGRANAWLTVSAFPGESPVFDAAGVQTDPRLRPHGAERDERLGRFQHDTGVIHAMGDPSGLRLQGLHIHNSRRAAISVYGAAERGEPSGGADGWARTRGVEVAFNTTYRSYSMGIITHVVDDLRIIGNRVIRPHSISMVEDPLTGEMASHDHLPQEGIDLSRNRRFEVAFNVVAGGGKEAIDAISVEDGSIHHNYVHSSLNGIYIDSWAVPIRGLKIHHNFLHNTFSGIPLATEGGNDLVDFEIHHNLILEAKSEGINVSEATYKAKPARVQHHLVHHNTIVGSGGHANAIGWQGAGISIAGFKDNPAFRDVLVRDNIVTDTTGRPLRNVYHADAAARGIRLSHNLVHPVGDTTPAWVRARAPEGWDEQNVLGENPILADPLFRDPTRGDFRLRPGSPAVGAAHDGSDLGALPAGADWEPGLDWAGATTAYFYGPTRWQPIAIPPEKFTLFRNHLQRPSWFQRNRYGVDFQNLPSGEEAFAGITFRVAPDDGTTPNVLALRGHSAETPVESITGIPIGRVVSRLAFLHNYHLANREDLAPGAVLFHYRVHYADGTVQDIPVRWGHEVDDWLGRSEDELTHLSHARLAWTQRVLKRRGVQFLRLYAMEWANPRPNVPVAALDLLNAQAYATGAPAVFAISAGAAE